MKKGGNKLKKITIAGIECVFYDKNLHNDNLVLMKYGSDTITTKQLKFSFDNLLERIGHTLTLGSMIDTELEKYNTALTVLKSLKMIFDKVGKPNRPPSKTDVKTTMDVITEIALANESDANIKNSFKLINIFSQIMLDND